MCIRDRGCTQHILLRVCWCCQYYWNQNSRIIGNLQRTWLYERALWKTTILRRSKMECVSCSQFGSFQIETGEIKVCNERVIWVGGLHCFGHFQTTMLRKKIFNLCSGILKKKEWFWERQNLFCCCMTTSLILFASSVY